MSGKKNANPKKMFAEMIRQWSYVPTWWADRLSYLKDRVEKYGSMGSLTDREIVQINRAYAKFKYFRGPRYVSGGAPSLGKRSSKWFNPRGLMDIEKDNDD